jgi:aspartate/methionine/tyrosine aminotransferase
MKEVLVTDGAYEALFTSIMGFVNPGDEVIIIEPYFDCYEPMVKLAGGTPRYIALAPVSRTRFQNPLLLFYSPLFYFVRRRPREW